MNAPEIERVVLEASELGWKPGVWPTHFVRDTRIYHFSHNEWGHDHELLAVVYEATSYVTWRPIARVVVLND